MPAAYALQRQARYCAAYIMMDSSPVSPYHSPDTPGSSADVRKGCIVTSDGYETARLLHNVKSCSSCHDEFVKVDSLIENIICWYVVQYHIMTHEMIHINDDRSAGTVAACRLGVTHQTMRLKPARNACAGTRFRCPARIPMSY